MPTTPIPELIEPGMRLGRHLNHDPRSRLFKVEAEPTGVLKDVDHAINIPVLTQRVGSCVLETNVANLGTGAVWATLTQAERDGLTQQFAEQLYRETTAADPYQGTWEPDDTGTDALSAAKVLRARGLISGWLHAFSPTTALQALQTAPVQTGIKWKTGCDTADSNGIIHWTGTVRGGHEVLAHRYDAKRQLVGIRNSWGTGWALNGECWMPVLEWQAALQDDGDALVLVPRDQPKPQPTPSTDWETLTAAMQPWADKPHLWRLASSAAQAWNTYRATHG